MIADRVHGVRPDPAVVRPRWRWGAIAVAVALLLFLAYWRLSWSVPANSDSAATTLQAHDLQQGNWALRGWTMSDVSFYTTEIPQYLLLELALGLGAAVVHIAAAMSLTLIVVLTALLAAGPANAAPARERLARALLAAVIVMSPQASAAWILLLGPDHTGTMVPVLATWLLLDRARSWRWLPVAVGVALTWIMVGDPIVLLVTIVPLILAALIRATHRRGSGRRRELTLALAAAIAAGLGLLIPHLISRFGGFTTWGLNSHLMPLRALPHDAWNVTQAVLTLLGADVVAPQPTADAVFAWLHLAGLILVVAGLIVALARFFRDDSIVPPALAVAIVLGLVAYLISVHASSLGSIREIVAVLPFGAVLAGRALAAPALSAARSPRARRGVKLAATAVATAVLAVGYLGGLSYDATRPAVPSANQDVADWLRAHHLEAGLASYWQAGSITLDTAGAVHVGAVVIGRQGTLTPYHWESSQADFSPAARFVISGGPASDAPAPGLGKAAIRTFGRPQHIYHVGATSILVWDRKLSIR